MKSEKENLEFNTLSDELLKEVSGGFGMNCNVLPGMPSEVRAAAEEANALWVKISAVQNAYRTGAISMQEYEARSDEIQRWMERVQDCMGTYNSYLQGTNAPIGR